MEGLLLGMVAIVFDGALATLVTLALLRYWHFRCFWDAVAQDDRAKRLSEPRDTLIKKTVRHQQALFRYDRILPTVERVTLAAALARLLALAYSVTR